MPNPIASSPAEILDAEKVRGLTGLQIMQEILAGRFSPPVISGVMHFRLTEVDAGRIVFRGTPAFAHANIWGATHGGWYGAILDSAMTCAAISSLPTGRSCTTLDYSVRLVRSIPLDTEVLCEATVRHAGRRTVVADGTIRDEAGKLYATGSTSCLVIDLGTT